MIYEWTCAWCGKKNTRERTTGCKPIYCGLNCRRAAQKEAERDAKIELEKEKAKRLKELMAKKPEPTPTLVPPEQCNKCKWCGNINGSWSYCGYSDFTGRTRTAQHPEGLTKDCKEFVDGHGKRLSLRQSLGLTKGPSEYAERQKYYELDPEFERIQRKVRKYLEEDEK